MFPLPFRPTILAVLLLSGCAGIAPTPKVPLVPVAGFPGIFVEAGYEARGRQIARLWRRAKTRVAKQLGQSFNRPVRLRICGSQSCMTALARNPGRNAESSRDGLLLGPGAFQNGLGLEKLLSHELVHALFRQFLGRRYGRVPAWFHEGVAVMVSGNGAEGVSAAQATAALRRGNHFTFYCRRDRLGFTRGFRPGGQIYYRQAALFVMHLKGQPARFRRLIARVLESADLCDAYRQTDGGSLRDLWHRYLRTTRRAQ